MPFVHEGHLAPSPSLWTKPLLRVMGVVTDFQADVPLRSEPLIDRVYAECGYDPLDTPFPRKTPSEEKTGSGAAGDRNIKLAFFYHVVQRPSRRDGRGHLGWFATPRGHWALNEMGIAASRRLWDEVLPERVREATLRVLGEQSHLVAGIPVRVTPERLLEALGASAGALGTSHAEEALDGVLTGLRDARLLNREGALTTTGVVAVRNLTRKAVNETSKWLAEHLTPEVRAILHREVSRRMWVSANHGMTDDHINQFVMRLVRRDALAGRIAEGKRIPISTLVSWCLNSAFTDVRDAANEPVMREMFGARTPKERENPVSVREDVRVWDHEGNPIVPEDPTRATDADRVAFSHAWGRIRKVVEARKGKAADQYVEVLTMCAEGHKLADIATIRGISRGTVGKVLRDARSLLRTARDEGRLEI